MLLIGKIEFDLEKRTLSFPKDTKDMETSKPSNIYLIGKIPYS